MLTGNYLAELTMLILGKDREKDPTSGYAKTFLRKMEQSLGLAMDRSARIVTNAGGLNPAGLADRLGELADRIVVSLQIAYVADDDLCAHATELGLGEPLTANAYLGARGSAALRAGAGIVTAGRRMKRPPFFTATRRRPCRRSAARSPARRDRLGRGCARRGPGGRLPAAVELDARLAQ